MQESNLSRNFLEVERFGEHGLFVTAALSLFPERRRALDIIIQEAGIGGKLGAEGERFAVQEFVARINTVADTALAGWMTCWQPAPPAWFRTEAIRVMILHRPQTTRDVTQVPLGPFSPPDVAPRLNRRAARQLLDAAWGAYRDDYLTQTYDEVERRARVFRHYEMAARYQFVPESAQAIADDVGVAKRSVQQAVHAVARAIGLPLRTEEPEGKLKPGRKNK